MVADIRVHAKLLRSLQHPTFVTPWTVACQAPLSMGFSWQEYWSGLPCPPPGGLPDPEIKPMSPRAPALQVGSLPLSHQMYSKTLRGNLFFFCPFKL